MGEAKRRKLELENWRSQLSSPERTIYDVCMRAYKNIVVANHMTGGCYHVSFFLAEYLRQKHNIVVKLIVGYINDQSDDVMIPHAWIEYEDKKIDLTLVLTDTQPKGPLLILDREVARGDISYTYHLEMSEAGKAVEQHLLRDERVRSIIEAKSAEHRRMIDAARSFASRIGYLAAAPNGMDYNAFSAMLD